MKRHHANCLQRLFSGFLSSVICLSMLPALAFADEPVTEENGTVSVELEEIKQETSFPEQPEGAAVPSEDSQSYTVSFAFDETAPFNAPEVLPEAALLPGEEIPLEKPVLSGYVFEGWQLDGVPVNESFVMPEGDVELVGSWSDYMPADEIIGAVFDGIVASASWGDCVFPEGTELRITAGSKETATAIGELALGAAHEVADAVAMDISFNSTAGLELQPYAGGEVHVELSLPEPIIGEAFYLIHVKDDGAFEFLPNAMITAERMENGLLQANTVSFNSQSFSVYLLVSTGDLDRYNRRTYEYYADGQLVFQQTVTVEDSLLDPGIPQLEAGREFGGWCRYDGETQIPTSIEALQTELLQEKISQDGEVERLDALIYQTHTVFFLEADGETEVNHFTVRDGESCTVPGEYSSVPDGWVFSGWLNGENLYEAGGMIPQITEDIRLLPKLNRLFVLSFSTNCDDSKVFSPPEISVEEGVDIAAYLPEARYMTRPGYVFTGWYSDPEAGSPVTGGTLTEDTTLYAGWNEAGDVTFTVKIWKQSVEDDYRCGLVAGDTYYDSEHDLSAGEKNYVFDHAVVLKGKPGLALNSVDAFNALMSPETGFQLPKTGSGKEAMNAQAAETVITANGSTTVSVFFDRQIWEMKFTGIAQREFHPDDTAADDVYGSLDGRDYFPVFRLLTSVYSVVDDQVTDPEDVSTQFGSTDGGNTFFEVYYRYAQKYSVATDNNGTQFRLSDDGRYIQVYKKNGVWRLTNDSNGEIYTGIRYKSSGVFCWVRTPDLTIISDGDEYTGPRYLPTGEEYVWFRNDSGTSVRYDGTRYVLTETEKTISFCGLYGQSFDYYGYQWPEDEVWSGVPYTDSFTDPGIFTDSIDGGGCGSTLHPEPADDDLTTIRVVFHVQETDGNYAFRAATAVYLGDEEAYNADDNLFFGFHLDGYAWTDSTEPPDGDAWIPALGENGLIPCTDRGSSTTLHLRYARSSYQVIFRDVDITGAESLLGTVAVRYGEELLSVQDHGIMVPDRTNHVFNGWFWDPHCSMPFLWEGAMPASDITLYAGWVKSSYRIVIEPCDSEDEKAIFQTGDDRSFLVPAYTVIPGVMPLRAGYRFAGLYTDADYQADHQFNYLLPISDDTPGMDLNYRETDEYQLTESDSDHVAGKLTLYVRWEKQEEQTVRVLYNSNRGENAPSDPNDYAPTGTVTALAACAAPEGFDFLCWIAIDDETGEELEIYPGHSFSLGRVHREASEQNGITTQTVVLTAKYVPHQQIEPIIITFHANGGTGAYSISCNANAPFSLPSGELSGISRDGYILKGWCTEPDGSGVVFAIGSAAAATALEPNILYAVWDEEITLTFTSNDDRLGSVSCSSVSVGAHSDETVAVEATPNESGEWIEWRLNGERVSTERELKLSRPESGWVTAEYQAVFKKRAYRVSFQLETDGVAAPAEQQVAYGDAVQRPADPSCNGYCFNGWKLDGLDYDFSEPVTRDLTLTGCFALIPYTITYDLNGGTVSENNPEEFTVESETVTLIPPVRMGYVFAGWKEASGTAAEKEVVIPKGSTGNRHYTATWIPSDDTSYQVIVHYPDAWTMPEQLEGAEIDREGRTAVFHCSGTTDSAVTTEAHRTQDDKRLIYDASNPDNVPEGTVDPSGSLVLHVYLKEAVYRYELHYVLKGTHRLVAAASGQVKPQQEGTARVSAALSNAAIDPEFKDYSSRIEIDGADEFEFSEDGSQIEVPVVISVSVDFVKNTEVYYNGKQQTGVQLQELTGSGFITVSEDGAVQVSGLLSGDRMVPAFQAASGTEPGAYRASFDAAAFYHEDEEVRYYRLSGFDPDCMGQLVILETLTAVWTQEDGTVLYTDPYVKPGSTPCYEGEPPVRDASAQFSYEFTGWDPEPSAIYYSRTYVARFSSKVREYRVVWLNDDGSENFSALIPYGKHPGDYYNGSRPEKAEDREYSYSFLRWSPDYEEVAEDIIYKPVFKTTPRSYTVAYLVDGEVYRSATAQFDSDVTLPEAPTKWKHSFSGWTADNASVALEGNTFRMPAENVTISGWFSPIDEIELDAASLTLDQQATAKNGLIYNGEEQTLIDGPKQLPDGYTGCLFSADSGTTWSDSIPTGIHAGEYSVLVKYVGDERHKDWVSDSITVHVGKAGIDADSMTAQNFVRPREGLAFTGEDQQLVIRPAALPEGSLAVRYSLDGGETWSDEIPCGNGADTYHVLPLYAGDRNHLDYVGDVVAVQIGKAVFHAGKLTDDQCPTAMTGLCYNGTEQLLLNGPNVETIGYPCLLYSVDDGESWSESIPAAVHTGTYSVLVKYIGDENHLDFSGESVIVTIAKAEIDLSDLKENEQVRPEEGLSYTGNDLALAAGPGQLPAGASSVSYSLDGGESWSTEIPHGRNAGAYSIMVRYQGDTDHEDCLCAPVSVTIAKALLDGSSLTAEQSALARQSMVFSDTMQDLVVPPETLPDGYRYCRYSCDGGQQWTQMVPSGRNAGDYSVLVEYVGDANHENYQAEPIAVRIEKAELTDLISVVESQQYTGSERKLVTVRELPEGVTLKFRVVSSDGTVVQDWSEEVPGASVPGAYQLYYRIDGGDNYVSTSASGTKCDVDAVILKGPQTVPSKPVVKAAGSGSVAVLNSDSGNEYILLPEGRTPKESDWTTARKGNADNRELTFGDLEAGKSYVVYARKAETEVLSASQCVASDTVSTEKGTQPKPGGTICATATSTSITVNPAASAQEYSIDGGNSWLSVPAGRNELIIDKLKPDTVYYLITRMAETESLSASEASDPVTVKTVTGELKTAIIRKGASISDVVVSGLDEALAMQLCTEAEIEKIQNGMTQTVFLEISDITASVPDPDRKLAEQKAKENSSNAVLCLALDLSLFKQMEEESPIAITGIGSSTLEVTLTIPASSRNPDSSVSRSFYLVRVHSGKAEVLTSETDGKTLTFRTGLFSTYALFYADKDSGGTAQADVPSQSSASASGTSGSSGGSTTPIPGQVSVTGSADGNQTNQDKDTGSNNGVSTGQRGSSSSAAAGNNKTTADSDADSKNDDSPPFGQNEEELGESQNMGMDGDPGEEADRMGKRIIEFFIIPAVLLILFVLIWAARRRRRKQKEYANRGQFEE